MGELIQSQTVIQQLPETLQPFVKARLEPQIKNLSPNQVKKHCVDILTKASSDMNSPMAGNREMLQIQTEALFNEITGKYKDLTLTELSEAFRRGIRGEFGPYFGLCAKTYHDFIKHYFNLPERQKAQIEYLNKISEVGNKSEVPVHIKIERSKEAIIKSFKEFKETGLLPLSSVAYYDLIREFKGVKSLVDKETFNKVQSEVVKEKQRDLKTAKKSDPLMASVIDDIMKNTKGNNIVTNEMKKRFLRIYFNQLINNNQNLEL